jgi:hypothetical protein
MRRVAAAGGRRIVASPAGARVDLLDAILGDLEKVLAVEGRARVRGDVDRAQRLAACRIDRLQRVARRKPDPLAVVGDTADAVDAGKRAVLADDLRR